MKTPRSLSMQSIIFAVLSLLFACSGGGGGSTTGTAGITYTGSTTPAALTASNANVIFSAIWNGGSSSGSTGSIALAPSAPGAASSLSQNSVFASLVQRVGKHLSRRAAGFTSASKMKSAVPINDTVNGKVSGTRTITGSLDDTTLTGTLTMTYANFNDGDGDTYDGSVTVRVDGYDFASDTLTDWTMTCTSWTVNSTGSSVTLSGSLRTQENVQAGSETLTINMDGRDNIANETFRFSNYVQKSTYDSLLAPTTESETYSGRLYLEKYGYVDISTTSSCVYSDPTGDPDSGGPIVLAGAGNTRAKITPVSANYVKIEVDNNGDGVIEDKNAYAWNNLGGAPVSSGCIANAGPDQTVSTGSLVTLDGSGSTDLSGGQLTFAWAMTAKPAGSSAVLSSPTQTTTTFIADVAGSYTITLTVGNGTTTSDPDTVIVTATGASVPTPISLVVSPSNPTVATGMTQQFSAMGSYSNLTKQDVTMSVTWKSSNTSVATISNTGLATVLSAGTSTITATYGAIAGSTLLTSIGVQAITLATNDIVYDSLRGKIYASVPSRAGNLGNTITVIDPATGATGTSVFVGSEPGKMAISDDGQFLYVSLDGAAAVRRLTLATMTPDIQFSMGSDSFFGPRSVDDMKVLPGQPHSVAIARKFSGVSPRSAGVAIYDDDVQRPTATPQFSGSGHCINVITFSANASTLYGYNNETTEFGFYRMNVDASGVSIADVTSNLFYGFFSGNIVFDAGLVYSATGQVVNPAGLTPTLAGTYSGITYANSVRPDSSLGKIFFVSGGSPYTLSAFNQATFTPIGTLTLPGNGGNAGSLVRWGATGLAFRTSGDQVFLLQNPVFQ